MKILKVTFGILAALVLVWLFITGGSTRKATPTACESDPQTCAIVHQAMEERAADAQKAQVESMKALIEDTRP